MSPSAPPATLPSVGHVQIYADYTQASLVPSMTGDMTPSGVASASSFYSSAPAWCAFNSGAYNGWITNGSALPAWIQYQFPTAKVITGYAIWPWSADNFPSRTPTAWKLQGSDDGLVWLDLDTRSFSAWIYGTPASFQLASPATCRYFRLYITANGGDYYTAIRRLELFGPSDAGLYLRDAAGNARQIAFV